MRNRYFSSIIDTFDFGMHRNQSLSDVIELHPDYIYWCINTIPEIFFSQKAIDEIRDMFPDFIIPISFEEHISEQNCSDDAEECDCYVNDDYVEDYWKQEEPCYGRYAGTWAQDYGGYSDDDIDTIFDGEPDAYWNID